MSDRESRVQLRVGIFVLAAIALFVAFVLTIGSQTRFFQARYTLQARFTSAGGLQVGAPVRLAGYTVGSITRIGFRGDLKDKKVVVEMSIDEQFRSRIREDSVATINTIGLVGDKYVELTVGSQDRRELPPLAEVAAIDPTEIGKLLESVSKLGVTLEEFFAGTGSKETRENLAALIASLRRTLVRAEEGRLVDQLTNAAAAAAKAGDSFTRVAGTADAALGDAQAILREVKEGKGLLNALVYGRAEDTLGKLGGALASLEDIVRHVKEGKGLLHTLIYDQEAGGAVGRLDRAARAVEDLARSAKEGPGLLHALIADPKGASLVADLADAAADLKRISGKLARGEGTLGALLDDPTLYEDLSALLRGAERSWILRTVIRSGLDQGRASQGRQ